MVFDLLDGHFIKRGEKIFDSGFAGELLFTETMRAIRNRLMFWDGHITQIESQLLLLNQKMPAFLKENAKELKRQIERTLVKNKLFKSALIDLIFFQNSDTVSYLVLTNAMGPTEYEFNVEGIVLETFSNVAKSGYSLSSSRMGSEPYWKILRTSQSSPVTEFILQNEKGCIVEVPFRNIYLVKGDQVSTAALETGTYLSPSRKITRTVCELADLSFSETLMITIDDLYQADEVFLSGDLHGIQWVKAFGMKRYRNKIAKMLNEEFNKMLLMSNE